MELEDGQVRVRGLVMGPGTPYKIREFSLWGRMARADQTTARAWAHGESGGAEWLQAVPVALVVRTEGANLTDWQRLLDRLLATWSPIGDGDDVEIRWRLGDQERVMYGRPRTVDPQIRHIRTGRIVTALAMLCPDPTQYSADLVTTPPIPLPVTTGGLAPPWTPPITITSTTVAGSSELVNAGTKDAALTLTIEAMSTPLVSPSITLVAPDGTISTLTVSLTLDVGQVLVLDTGRRTAVLNGVVSRRSAVTGRWPLLPGTGVNGNDTNPPPAVSILQFRATAYSATARLTPSWRHAWW